VTAPTPRPTPPTPPFPPPGPWGPKQPSDLRTALAAVGVLAVCLASWVPPAGAFYVFHLILDHFTGVTQ